MSALAEPVLTLSEVLTATATAEVKPIVIYTVVTAVTVR
jgi:hypothetical protein